MKTMINLLPRAYRRQQMIRRRAVQWGSVITAVLLVGWAAHWYEQHENMAMSQELEVLVREQQPTQTMLRELVGMRRQLEELQQQEQIARELENQRNALVLLAVISRSVQRTDGRLRVTKMELTGFQHPSAAEASATSSSGPDGLLLSGLSLDHESVGELLDGLHDSGIFSKVELRSSKELEENDASLRDYEVRCTF